jgi:hypothetical protein
VAIGTYAGSGGHGDVALTAFGILVGGAFLGQQAGEVMVVAVPALQIAVAMAMARE